MIGLCPENGAGGRHYGYRKIHRARARLYPIGAGPGASFRQSAIHPRTSSEGSSRRRRRTCRATDQGGGRQRRRARQANDRALASCRKSKAAPDKSIWRAKPRGCWMRAEQAAKKAGDSFVTAEYLLLALADVGRNRAHPEGCRRHPPGPEQGNRRSAPGPQRRQRDRGKFL